MPYSISLGLPDLIQWVSETEIKTVLDVGAGAGLYSDGLKGKVDKIDALEVFEHYIGRFNLSAKYDNVILGDAREHTDFNYDLVILGDVIEHMKREEAVALWCKISQQAKYAFISMPIGECTQHGQFYDHENDITIENPYEEHVEPESTLEEILAKFPCIFKHKLYDIENVATFGVYFQIGAFYAKFK